MPKLCASGGAVVMKDSDTLMSYNLAADVSIILTDPLMDNELLRFRFDNPVDLAYEEVSKQQGTFEYPGDAIPVDTLGRTGIEFTGRSVLRLPIEIQLARQWTVSLWMLAPIVSDIQHHNFRDLLDSLTQPQSLIAVIIDRGRLGCYGRGSIQAWNVSQLSDGWHHLAVVGENQVTTFYIDGQQIGCVQGQPEGSIGVVGNSIGHHESWGVMSDLRIFGHAADELQVRRILQESWPDWPGPEVDNWQSAVAARNQVGRETDQGSDTDSE